MKFNLILAVMLCGGSLYAQIPDTLQINIGDYGQMNVSSLDIFIEDNDEKESLNSLFKLFYTDYQLLQKKIEPQKYVDVFYSISENNMRRISIKKREKEETQLFINNENKYINEPFFIKLHIPKHIPRYEIVTITIKDERFFKQILEIDLDSLLISAKKDLKAKLETKEMKERRAYKVMYNSIENIVNTETSLYLMKNAKNHFLITPIAGINLLGDDGFAKVGANLELILSRKQFPRYRFGIEEIFSLGIHDYNFQYNRDFPIYVTNLRVSIYAGKNFSRKVRNELMLGLSAISIDNQYVHYEKPIFSAFAQYNLKKFGIRLNYKIPSSSEFKEYFKDSDNSNEEYIEMPYDKYGQTLTLFYLF